MSSNFQRRTLAIALYIICISHFGFSQQILKPSDQPEAYFNGSSYVRFETTLSLKRLISFSFRTCSGGELFSQQHIENAINLSVNMDGVLFDAKVDDQYYEAILPGNFVNNKWHVVELDYKLGNLTLSVDDNHELIANKSFRLELLTSPYLYDDGAIFIVGNHYKGCILEGPSVIFNSTIITTHNVIFGPCPIPIDSCTPREDFKTSRAIDYCSTEPCMRQGICINGQNTYSCICSPRYTGKNCEIDLGNVCEKTQPCKNGGTCAENNGNYLCKCVPGFGGKQCEQEILVSPLCNPSPCLNDGICLVRSGSKIECSCLPGYSGPKCEININECQSSPCLNGGECIDGNNSYSCDCTGTGYSGKLCEHNINECINNPCLNHGVCFDNYGSYTCQCVSGFGGKNCQYNIYECLSRPCLNNGQCVDKVGGYECHCPFGFTGNNCEIELQHNHCTHPNCSTDTSCANNVCVNGGTCNPNLGSYNCTCLPGFTGPACERIKLCSQNVCKNGGSCVEDAHSYRCVCVDGFKGIDCNQNVQCADDPCEHAIACRDFMTTYYCTCEPDWTGFNCNVNLNSCSNQPCINGGTCIDLLKAHKCQCLQGFTGKNCQIDIDECSSAPCLNDGICIDKPNGFYCNCTEQWMGVSCERPYNICETKPCLNNGTCIPSTNKREFSCDCLKGYEGHTCESDIDECSEIICPKGQICVDLIGEYECKCPAGYVGENCTFLAEPCLNSPCTNEGTCVVDSLTHNFSCMCQPGYTGLMCEQDINECENPGVPICNHGICVNKPGSFQCYCMPGYTGETCSLDFDECLSMPCRNNATCLNKINNFECSCPPGYTSKDCSVNINECSPMPCLNGSTCIDGINEFTCVCLPGLTGKLCQINIDDCESSPCSNGAKCIDGLNSYSCDCTDTGFFGTHCELNIDDCVGNPCVNGARCVDDIKNYHCKCFPGYSGKNCEEDINECEGNPCKNSGICLEKSNMTLYHPNVISALNITLPEAFNKPFDYTGASGYECMCVLGVTGRNCEVNVNECESSPCVTGACVDKIGGYICECEEGFEGEHCQIDIDECKKYHPCKRGTCMDRRANYYCECEPEYGGKNCSVQLIGCVENPCSNNGTCKPYLVNETEHKFNCSCSYGFHGHTCEKITTMSLSGHSLVTINTTRDEGYDIQFRFKTTLGDGLLALGKGLTYYILELSRGRLNLHSSLLNKWEGVFIGSNLNDSKWQRVFVAINSSHLVLSANDEQTIYPITFNENYNVTSTSFPTTYIGGTPSNLRKLTHGQPFLVGCLEDVLINNEWVLPEVQTSRGMSFQSVEVGCHREPQCNPNPCHSGGHCTDKWRDFSCTCERPYLGHTCQYNYTAATFGHENTTTSLVTVTVADAARRAIRSIVDISMFIRTRQSRGQIFYLGSSVGPNSIPDETYIAAQLEGGELLVRIQFNSTPEAYTVGGVKLNDGYNHLIEVIRNVTLVQVKLNGTEYFRKTISSTGTLDAQVLFLGGQPQLRPVRQADNPSKAEMTTTGSASAVTTPLSMIHFKGIIQDVQISNGSKTMVVEFFPLNVDDLDIPMSFGTVIFDNTTILEGIHSDDSCKTNPCRNGNCFNTWNDYRCECFTGFKGKNCTEVEFCELEGCPQNSECRNLEDGHECIANATFNGETSPMLYDFEYNPEMKSIPHFNILELTYRSKSWGTPLFVKHLQNYFAIFIDYNKVVVKWSVGGQEEIKQFHKDHFEGQWLTLHLEIKETKLKGGFKEMINDDIPNFVVDNFDSYNFTEMFVKGSIYVGGSDNKTFNYWDVLNVEETNNTLPYATSTEATTETLLTSNAVDIPEATYTTTSPVPFYKFDYKKTDDKFKGCLGEVRIGKLLLPFYPSSSLYRSDNYPKMFFNLRATKDAEIGCRLCYETDCLNEGWCQDPANTYNCQCRAGFTSDDCSVDIDECELNRCENNSTCIDKIAEYECKCAAGYHGNFCENEIDECESNPCHHGGTCIDLLASFKCECSEDYVGKQCEALRLITCENEPCKEGATCQDGKNLETGNNFTCICNDGYVGPLCDTPYCLRQHCEFGYCNTTELKPICQCQRGFEGKYCEVNINDCVLPSGGTPCQHRGICIDGINRYDCNCTGTGYSGLLCELDIDECTSIEGVCGPGSCSNVPGSYMCNCPLGNCGFRCEEEDPCLSDPCVHGTCEPICTHVPDYECKCEDDWTGKNCTENKLSAAQEGGGVNILYIIIPIILIILIAFLIGTVILVNMARSKRATRGTYSPSAQEFCNPRVELDHVLKPPPEERLI